MAGGKKLKVYGGNVYRRGIQMRGVVAVHNKKELAGILGETLYHVGAWWRETSNKNELKLALAKPLRIIYVER